MKRFVLCALMALSLAAHAGDPGPVDVQSAWARPTVTGQIGAGAFMRLTSKDGARVIGVATAVAGVAEIHEMVMDGSVMRMRPIANLELPPGQPIDLKPGGRHLMLMDLKRPLAVGEKVKVELRIETRDKKLVTQPVEIEIRLRAP